MSYALANGWCSLTLHIPIVDNPNNVFRLETCRNAMNISFCVLHKSCAHHSEIRVAKSESGKIAPWNRCVQSWTDCTLCFLHKKASFEAHSLFRRFLSFSLSLSLASFLFYPLCQSTNTIGQVQAWRFRDIVTSAYSYTGLFEVLWKAKRRQIPKSNEDSHWYATASSCNVSHDLPSSNIAELCLSIRPWTYNDEKQLIYVQ